MVFKRATVNWRPKPRNPHFAKRPRTCRTFSALPDFTDRITTLTAVTKTTAIQWWLLPWLDINSTLLPLPDSVQPAFLAPPPQQRPNKCRAIFSLFLLWCTIAILAVIFLPSYVSPAQSSLCWQNNMINKCYLLFQTLRDSVVWLHLFSHYSRAKRNLKLASLATLLYPLSRKEVSHNLPVPKYSISWRKIWWIMFACAAALREGKRHVIQSWWMSAFVDKPVVCGDQVNKSLYLTLMRISIA